MWYSHSLLRPVDSKSVRLRTVTKEVNASEIQTAIISGLTVTTEDIIVDNTVVLTIDGTVQTKEAYVLLQYEGAIYIDVTDLDGDLEIAVTYELVELTAEVSPESGEFVYRVNKHVENEYIVRVLFSNATGGTITYQYLQSPYTESIRIYDLYEETIPELVADDSFNYAFDGKVYFPTSRTFRLFAIRPEFNEESTILYMDITRGRDLKQPWFMRVVGSSLGIVDIKEMPELRVQHVKRKEQATILNNYELSISGRKLVTAYDESGKLSGIDIYQTGRPENRLEVSRYNEENSIIRLTTPAALTAKVTVEYTEEITWIDYDGIQMNPSLEVDPEVLLSNYVLFYIDESQSPVQSIFHKLLPKVVAGDFKQYTVAELTAIVAAIHPDAIPMSFVSIVEPVDEDYYIKHDVRTRGGYTLPVRTITDVALWDGEDVDISGVLVAKVPVNIVNQIKQDIEKWEGITDDNELIQAAKVMIESKIEKYKRIGMKVFIDYEVE